MSNAEQRDIAEASFAPKQSREEIRNAIKLEEASARLWSKTYTA